MDGKAHYENRLLGYSEKHDARYDITTGEWLEGTCDDAECPYCKGRPEKADKHSGAENTPLMKR